MKQLLMFVILSFSFSTFAAEVCSVTTKQYRNDGVPGGVLIYIRATCTNEADNYFVVADTNSYDEIELKMIKSFIDKGYTVASSGEKLIFVRE